MRKILIVVTAAILLAGVTALANAGERPGSANAATRTRTEFTPFAIPAIEVEPTPDPHPESRVSADKPKDSEDQPAGTEERPSKEPSDVATTTTEAPADISSPHLQILHPVDGQVFEHKEVVFEGTTEHGARVFAGEYEAEVNDDGAWRIVLFLSPGSNHVVFRALDAAGNVSEAVVQPVLQVPADHEKPDFEFSAHQKYGSCSENPPYDIFYGTGRPGDLINVYSEYGSGATEVTSDGHWEVKVFFPSSPVGVTFAVTVQGTGDERAFFEFKHTE